MTSRTVRLGLMALVVVGAAALSPVLAAPKNQIQVFMVNTGMDGDARGRILVVENKAQVFFKIKVTGLAPGTYDVLLDAAIVDSIVVGPDGEGKLSHRARLKGKSQGTLPYDPRGGMLEIASTGTVMLASHVPATPEEAHALVEMTLTLTPMPGVAGSAEVEFRTRFGRMKLEVELDGVAPGTYKLFVGGSEVGEITAAADGEGEIEFDSRPSTDDDGGDELDLLMTFDPRDTTIEVRDATGVTVLFTGILI